MTTKLEEAVARAIAKTYYSRTIRYELEDEKCKPYWRVMKYPSLEDAIDKNYGGHISEAQAAIAAYEKENEITDQEHEIILDAGQSRVCLMSDWEKDCLHWHRRVLTGEKRHYCYEWDELPIDETCPEFDDACICIMERLNQ